MRSFAGGACIALLCGLLTACTPAKTVEAVSKMSKIAMNPDMPIGEPKDQPSKATITLYEDPGVNRNADGQTAPVDVWVFQLSDDGKLMTSDFMSLSQDPKATLGTSYVSHKEKQVAPGQSEILSTWELDKETSFIGVAVGYQAIDMVNWRTAEKVNATGENYNILIPIRAKGVSVQVHR
ncbi:type VI secretion system lipoprotein TssJ [Phyllobacterium leguminum]|uniref:Type VI secretion system protein VasD n=1 Tax=Phyllobacterium leguminum TaxID=314237 RepID=A0A318STT8_9HYPH|nr:type VI secretion system lipoprotein TssJ [Phyllobacterium leguminum]PYE85280.1 type VI secretion system protein VasD [Phyllobacterium leguminum]